ncbi:hypothetical protein LCGC14_1170060 [marine sediment metagenome]|uniref:Uncharacterized protein n=1 Tax=marine sediment metagenome TaxID=412755 RepID=A0A0F9LUZ4_9ZZZZ
MGYQRVGTCSICGGNVMGHRGGWWSINPPPPDECADCGAVAQLDIIKMHPAPRPREIYTSQTTTDGNPIH